MRKALEPCPICDGNPPRCSRAQCYRDRWCECDLPVCPECNGAGVVPAEDATDMGRAA